MISYLCVCLHMGTYFQNQQANVIILITTRLQNQFKDFFAVCLILGYKSHGGCTIPYFKFLFKVSLYI